MKKIVTLTVEVKPALDMRWLTNDDVEHSDILTKDELLKGFNLTAKEAEECIWIPIDMDDADYAEFRKLDIPHPDHIPVRCGEHLGDTVVFHMSGFNADVDDARIEFVFDNLYVHTNMIPSWWTAKRHALGYGA